MRKKFALGAAAAVAMMTMTASVAFAQAAPPASAPVRIDGHPNMNGIWSTISQANWDLEPHSAQSGPLGGAGERVLGTLTAEPAGLGVVDGGKIPYRPDALARLQDNKAHRVGHDPEAACYLPGIPRATYINNMPFQIVQGGGDDMLMVYEYANANRVIEMRAVEVPPIDTWMGTSYGRWQGDTLVVTTLAQSPGEYKAPAGEMFENATWLDRQGNYLTNSTTVTERFKPMGPNHIDYSATIDDPTLYTKPWTIRMPLYKHVEANAQLLEFRCVPFSEMLLYGDLLENRGAPAMAPATGDRK
ncbi:MAG: hypothetical protein ABIT09_09670 [Croceibacterium sp.]